MHHRLNETNVLSTDHPKFYIIILQA